MCWCGSGDSLIGTDVNNFLPDDARRRDAIGQWFLDNAISQRRHFAADVVLHVGKETAAGRDFVVVDFLDCQVTDSSGGNEGLRADEVIDRPLRRGLRWMRDG